MNTYTQTPEQKNWDEKVGFEMLKFYIHCLAGKQRRVSFYNASPFRMHNVLDVIPSDVCDPMKN